MTHVWTPTGDAQLDRWTPKWADSLDQQQRRDWWDLRRQRLAARFEGLLGDRMAFDAVVSREPPAPVTTSYVIWRACYKSGHPASREVVGFRKANGIIVAREQCGRCGDLHPNEVKWPREQIDGLRIVVDNLGSSYCERCGAAGAELHHWAPTEVFKAEADEWPTSYLCRECHTSWHTIINQARAGKRPKTRTPALNGSPLKGAAPPVKPLAEVSFEKAALVSLLEEDLPS